MDISTHQVSDPEHVSVCIECQRFHEEANRLEDEAEYGEDWED